MTSEVSISYNKEHNGIPFYEVDIINESIFDYVEIIWASNGEILGYSVLCNIGFYSKRYNKWIIVEAGDKSDGATSAPDIDSFCWIFHDDLCNTGLFGDGTKCNNWQASMILSDILAAENRNVRRFTWFIGTWLIGGGKARENGMW